MKKIILVLLSLIVIAGIIVGGIFAYGKYKEFNDLKDQVELNNNSNNETENLNENNQQEQNQPQENNQQEQNQPQEDTQQEQKVNRNNVFDYIIYCIEDNGRDKNDYSFNEPEYDSATGNWTVYAGNKGGAGGGYTFYVNQRGDVNVVESNSSEEIYSTYDINLN